MNYKIKNENDPIYECGNWQKKITQDIQINKVQAIG